jgi:uroporphyrinogen-III synthase
MRPLIILLKSPDESAESDPYALALHDVGLDAAFLPVLRHAPVNERELQEVISRGAETAYGGVIVTSSRAAEMWSRAATGAMSALSSNGFDGESTP